MTSTQVKFIQREPKDPALTGGKISIGQLKVTGTSWRRISHFHELPDRPRAEPVLNGVEGFYTPND